MHILFILALFLSVSLLNAQVPQQVKAFQEKMSRSEAPVTYSECSENLATILQLSTGYFDTGEQEKNSPLFRHIYRAFPIWEKPVEGKYWFYEEIALGVEADKPFSQRVFSYEEDAQGHIVRHYYYSPQLENYTNAWKNPQEISDNIQLGDLTKLSGCGMAVQKIDDNLYYLAHDELSCHEPMSGPKGYVQYEYYLFSGGLATRPLAYDSSGRLVWGEPNTWYLTRKMDRAIR